MIDNPCASTAVGDIHMPRTQRSEGNFPLTAVSTGAVDSMGAAPGQRSGVQ